LNKFNLFVENFLVYGLGGVISKLIPLIMIPIVIMIMPTTDYYGISDLSNTIVQFGSAMAIMGMYDAMYRMFFEKNDENYQRKVCSTALVCTLLTSVIVFFIILLFRDTIAQYFFSDKKYSYVVYFSAMATLIGATNSIISAPTRMQNKRHVFLVTNTISPFLAYLISIPMLLAGYYVIALPLAAVISGITMEIAFAVMNRKWFRLTLFDRKLLKQLLVIAIPLLPNFLIYWVFNSCDKIMITNIIGISATGIYSVGSNLGHVSQLIYAGFAGGWQFFAFSMMKEEHQVELNSRIFEYLGIISFVATAFICAWSYEIFKLLFRQDYLNGYIVAPYLFMAPLLLMLFQVAANQFLVVKKTWPNFVILSLGVVLNVLFNYFLIPIFGIEGASIATLIGYIISDIICVIVLCKMRLMVVSKKFIIASLLIAVYMFFWRMYFSKLIIVATFVALCLSVVIVLIYKEDFTKLLNIIKNSNFLHLKS